MLTVDLGATRVLDRVIAVVNNQVILGSDLDLEARIFHLLPIGEPQDNTAPKALQRLITRALIEQQIFLEDPQGMQIAPQELTDSLAELRQNLPACKHRDCASPAGWQAYLATLNLSPDRVQSYWADRLAILRFIEQRFRSGIRIGPDEIQKYYQQNLLPRYSKPEDAPPLAQLSPRIQEILLQQQVNTLMDEWLKSLQSQGQVEVLDASLRTPQADALTKPATSPSKPATSLSKPATSLSTPPDSDLPASGPALPQSQLPAIVTPSASAPSPLTPPPGRGGCR